MKTYTNGKLTAVVVNPHGGSFPHDPMCQACGDARECNFCGKKLERNSKCTNNRCAECHATVCAPGHHFWREGVDVRRN